MSRHLPSPLFRPSRLALLLAVSYPCAGWADAALTLDPVVVTGSRVETRSFDLPAAIEVVDAERIGAGQARVNASEALAGVPGISVANRQNYAQDLQISSRGFGARSAFGVRGVRLVADGIPASMPDGQGQAATFNLDRAERMEVMRGPMSAVYGNSAGGVIQLFTRDGKGRPSVEGGFSAGSYGSWKTDLAADGSAGGVGYVIDASRFATEGYRDHSRAERDQLLAKLSFAPSDDGKLTLVASSFRQEAQDPLGLSWASYLRDPRSVDPSALQFNTRKSIDQQQGGLNYVHRFGEQRVEVSAYAGKRAVTQYQSIPTGVQGNVRHSGGVIDFDRDYMGVNARWIGRFAVAGGALTTTVGVDYEESEDDRRGYENFTGTGAAQVAAHLLDVGAAQLRHLGVAQLRRGHASDVGHGAVHRERVAREVGPAVPGVRLAGQEQVRGHAGHLAVAAEDEFAGLVEEVAPVRRGIERRRVGDPDALRVERRLPRVPAVHEAGEAEDVAAGGRRLPEQRAVHPEGERPAAGEAARAVEATQALVELVLRAFR